MLKEKLYQGPIYVKKSPIHGYGVFAAADIKAGELIEECYALLAPADDRLFQEYYFRGKDNSVLPLGYGCLYNHSADPNIAYEYQPTIQAVVFKARRDIHRGEELFSYYGDTWFSARGLQTSQMNGWRRFYQLASGILLRCSFILLGLWGIIEGTRFLGRFSW